MRSPGPQRSQQAQRPARVYSASVALAAAFIAYQVGCYHGRLESSLSRAEHEDTVPMRQHGPSGLEGIEAKLQAVDSQMKAMLYQQIDMQQRLTEDRDHHVSAAPLERLPVLSQGGKAVPCLVAISIQASEGKLSNLEQLLEVLEHPEIAAIVHLDLKAPAIEHEKLKQMVEQFMSRPHHFAGLAIMTPAVAVSYRGVTMLDVTLRIIEKFVQDFEGWRYFINVSAQDLPLLQAHELVSLLGHEAPEHLNFLDAHHNTHFRAIFSRLTHVVVDEGLHRHDAPPKTNYSSSTRRRYPTLFDPYHGEAWGILSYQFCHYIASSTDGLVRRLFSFYANAPSSAEGFFQTLLCSSPYSSTLVNDCFRYVDWSKPNLQHPPDISKRHIPKLRTEGALFARKFSDFAVMQQVMETISRVSPPGAFNSSVAIERARLRLQLVLDSPQGCTTVQRHQKEGKARMLHVGSGR